MEVSDIATELLALGAKLREGRGLPPQSGEIAGRVHNKIGRLAGLRALRHHIALRLSVVNTAMPALSAHLR